MHRRTAWFVSLLWTVGMSGCAEPPVELRGTVHLAPYGRGPVAAGAQVSALDRDMQPLDEAVAGADGSFTLTGPPGEPIVAVVRGDGLVPAGFIGVFGRVGSTVPDGSIFAWTDEAQASLRDRYAGCPRADEPGGVVHGQIALAGVFDEETGDPALVVAGWAGLRDLDGTLREACYVDPETGRFDPEAHVAGEAGEFAVFGLVEGVHQLLYGYDVSEEFAWSGEAGVYVPEEGIAPVFAAQATLVGQ